MTGKITFFNTHQSNLEQIGKYFPFQPLQSWFFDLDSQDFNNKNGLFWNKATIMIHCAHTESYIYNVLKWIHKYNATEKSFDVIYSENRLSSATINLNVLVCQ